MTNRATELTAKEFVKIVEYLKSIRTVEKLAPRLDYVDQLALSNTNKIMFVPMTGLLCIFIAALCAYRGFMIAEPLYSVAALTLLIAQKDIFKLKDWNIILWSLYGRTQSMKEATFSKIDEYAEKNNGTEFCKRVELQVYNELLEEITKDADRTDE